MAIIYQFDKRSGITYAYESTSVWDKEKKQSRSKRRLIGRVNPETKEIIPTDGRGKKRSPYNTEESAPKSTDELLINLQERITKLEQDNEILKNGIALLVKEVAELKSKLE